MEALIETLPVAAAMIIVVGIFIRYQIGRDAQHAATIKALVEKHDGREEKGQEIQETTNVMLGRVHESLNNNTAALNTFRQ